LKEKVAENEEKLEIQKKVTLVAKESKLRADDAVITVT
jgi:hypothetical protein